MSNKLELREWVDYQPIWLVIGLILLVLLVAWYFFVFFSTRRRKQQTLATLKPRPYIPPDLTNLKAKYQTLIYAAVERGNVHEALELSRKVVAEWN